MCFFFLRAFAYHIMESGYVYFSKANCNDIIQNRGVDPLKELQVRENCRSLLFIKMSRNYRYCLNPDCEALPPLTGEMQSFGKVSTNFFPLRRFSLI